MVSKSFITLVCLSSCALVVFILYYQPLVPIESSRRIILQSVVTSNTSLSIGSLRPIIRQSIVTAAASLSPVSTSTRRFAIFSSSIHSKLRSYIFYTPIAAAAWQRIGYEVIVVFVGDFTQTSSKETSLRLNLSRAFLQRLGVRVIDFQCPSSYSIKMSQLVRAFAGFLPATIVGEKDFILTTDSDILPLRESDYEISPNNDGFIYNAYCCGSFQRRSKTYRMYPMSHLCLSKLLWRNLFLQSVQRNELLQSNLDAELLSERAPFSFETISLYARQEFGALYDSNMTKGDSAWYMDQVLCSMLLNDYIEKYPKTIVDKRQKTSLRLDSNAPYHMWERQRLPQFGDAHLMHDEIFDSYRWTHFKHLLLFLFNAPLANDFDLYYKQFLLTLNDQPPEG